MTTPPRTAELLLEAMGADADFRDDLLGDLAEEFSIRARWDGSAAARRWYLRESFRTAPHLVRDWLRRLRVRGIMRLAGLALTSYVFTAMLVMFVFITVRVVMQVLSIPFPTELFAGTGPGPIVLGLVVSFISALVGGYVAAWLDEQRAPLASALSLGAIWSCAGLAIAAVRGDLGWNCVAPVFVVLGAAAGGIIRVCTSRADARRPTT